LVLLYEFFTMFGHLNFKKEYGEVEV